MDRYDPKGHAKRKESESIIFNEAAPPPHLSRFVHRFLEIKTTVPLEHDFKFYALPDACTYVILDQNETQNVGVTKLRIASEEFNLGKVFHFVNIRFYPGVWQRGCDLSYGQVNHKYSGDLPLVDYNRKLKNLNFDEKQILLSDLVSYLLSEAVLVENATTQQLILSIDKINSVEDMAKIVEKSPRQLQRIIKNTTGLTPHDFLKVLRMQKTLVGHPLDNYADQSHFIRSLRSMTGYTPSSFKNKFDV